MQNSAKILFFCHWIIIRFRRNTEITLILNCYQKCEAITWKKIWWRVFLSTYTSLAVLCFSASQIRACPQVDSRTIPNTHWESGRDCKLGMSESLHTTCSFCIWLFLDILFHVSHFWNLSFIAALLSHLSCGLHTSWNEQKGIQALFYFSKPCRRPAYEIHRRRRKEPKAPSLSAQKYH